MMELSILIIVLYVMIFLTVLHVMILYVMRSGTTWR